MVIELREFNDKKNKWKKKKKGIMRKLFNLDKSGNIWYTDYFRHDLCCIITKVKKLTN